MQEASIWKEEKDAQQKKEVYNELAWEALGE